MDFLPRTVTSNGRVFERMEAMTDYRECHDSSIREARILFLCRAGEVYVMKVKVQLAEADVRASEGTEREVMALKTLRAPAPSLVAFESMVQANDGPLPGGYITFTIMTRMPGTDLLEYKYWSIGIQERLLIQKQFLLALRFVMGL